MLFSFRKMEFVDLGLFDDLILWFNFCTLLKIFISKLELYCQLMILYLKYFSIKIDYSHMQDYAKI